MQADMPAAATLGARLERLHAAAATLPDGHGGRLSDDADLGRRFGLLGVELMGLAVLEQRARDAGDDRLTAAASLRARRAALHLAELGIDVFGPYALAFPDPLLIDNEGPIGHDYALAAVQHWLRNAAAGAGPEVLAAQDRLGRRLLGGPES